METIPKNESTDLQEIARMAEIDLSDEELKSLEGEIEDVLDFIGDLDDLDLGSIDELFGEKEGK
jgi:Asp-tRNA(Asn)/Glu-tRNA(Gln) amidotransferase C subunit